MSKYALALALILSLGGCMSKPKEVEAFKDAANPVKEACLARKDIKPELCSCINKEAKHAANQKSQAALAGYMLMTSKEDMGTEIFSNRNEWRIVMQNSMYRCSKMDDENTEMFFGLMY